MSKINHGGPAFPHKLDDRYEPDTSGMTLRQYAAIKLRVPDSGTDWLDQMIQQSLRDDFAAKAMQQYMTARTDEHMALEQDLISENSLLAMSDTDIADAAYRMASAMLLERVVWEDIDRQIEEDDAGEAAS